MRRTLSARMAALAAIVVAVLFWHRAMMLYTDYLWFSSQGFQQVLTLRWFTQLFLGVAAGGMSLVFIYANVFVARRIVPVEPPSLAGYFRLPPLLVGVFNLGQLLTRATLPVSLVLAAGLGFHASTHWLELWAALRATTAGHSDPIFHKDLSFYLLRYPFYEWVWSFALTLVILSLALVAFVYLVSTAVQISARRLNLSPRVMSHFSLLLFLIAVLIAAYYRLESFRLLYVQKDAFYGAGYTEVHMLLRTFQVSIALAVLTAGMLLANLKFRLAKPLTVCIFLLIGVPVLGRSLFAPMMQRLVVVPNELRLEKPYINSNIQSTLDAYDLAGVERRTFTVSDALTAQHLRKHAVALSSVRLWDHRPLSETYQQLQGIRPYYRFLDVDLDRYMLGGKYRQVAISPRELDTSRLPTTAQNWVNLHLKYTHGYGFCLSPVNETTEEGLPRLLVKDIPPVSETPLSIRRPEIYFGEADFPYVLTNTDQPEFDYPRGDTNESCSYQGKRGIGIGNAFRKAAFATRFNDWKIMLYRGTTKQSQILMRRNLRERLRDIAPFLMYDNDPYLVAANGDLYWIVDAYTASNNYPYSAPSVAPSSEGESSVNYFRNSIKVVINAYDGETRFYLYRTDDPIAQTYHRIFPALFFDMKDMPKGLEAHLRYPLDLMKIQSDVFSLYHMTNPETFYAKEDPWRIAHEIVESKGNEQPMEPYYVIMQLPNEENERISNPAGFAPIHTEAYRQGARRASGGSPSSVPSREEFVLIAPFTPQRRQNMIAWMCARCDPPNRGRLIAYQLTKGQTVEGPMQIEALIDQDTEISKLMTLWGQMGSSVFRGNMILLPLENSLLYIKPIYLKASAIPLPELKQVIVAYRQRVVMTRSLSDSLAVLFGAASAPSQGVSDRGARSAPPSGASPPSAKMQTYARRGLELYNKVEQAFKAGDWKGFGEAMKRLEETLNKLNH